MRLADIDGKIIKVEFNEKEIRDIKDCVGLYYAGLDQDDPLFEPTDSLSGALEVLCSLLYLEKEDDINRGIIQTQKGVMEKMSEQEMLNRTGSDIPIIQEEIDFGTDNISGSVQVVREDELPF